MKVCKIDSCERVCRRSSGFCDMHHLRKINGTDMNAPIRYNKKSGLPRPVCSVDDCERTASSNKMCSTHNKRKNRGIDLNLPLPHKVRVIRPVGSVRIDSKGYLTEKRRIDSVPSWLNSVRSELGKTHGWYLQHWLVWIDNNPDYIPHPKDNIHHKNGQRDDNRIENLELWSTSQPAGQRVGDKIDWMVDFLDGHAMFVKDEHIPKLKRLLDGRGHDDNESPRPLSSTEVV